MNIDMAKLKQSYLHASINPQSVMERKKYSTTFLNETIHERVINNRQIAYGQNEKARQESIQRVNRQLLEKMYRIQSRSTAKQNLAKRKPIFTYERHVYPKKGALENGLALHALDSEREFQQNHPPTSNYESQQMMIITTPRDIVDAKASPLKEYNNYVSSQGRDS